MGQKLGQENQPLDQQGPRARRARRGELRCVSMAWIEPGLRLTLSSVQRVEKSMCQKYQAGRCGQVSVQRVHQALQCPQIHRKAHCVQASRGVGRFSRASTFCIFPPRLLFPRKLLSPAIATQQVKFFNNFALDPCNTLGSATSTRAMPPVSRPEGGRDGPRASVRMGSIRIGESRLSSRLGPRLPDGDLFPLFERRDEGRRRDRSRDRDPRSGRDDFNPASGPINMSGTLPPPPKGARLDPRAARGIVSSYADLVSPAVSSSTSDHLCHCLCVLTSCGWADRMPRPREVWAMILS